MRDVTNRIINRIPGFYTRNDKSVLIAIIDSIAPEIEFLYKQIKQVSDIISIDKVHGDDIWARFGSMFNTPKYSYEDDIAYRGRIKAIIASKYGGVKQLIKNTVASYVGIRDSNDVDKFIKVTGAWEYEGTRIPEQAKRPGHFLCDIDPVYMVNHDVSISKIIQLINSVKAAGVHVYTTITFSTDKDRTELSVDDRYFNKITSWDDDNVNILVGIGRIGSFLNDKYSTFNGSLIFNQLEDIISTADEHVDNIEYIKRHIDDISVSTEDTSMDHNYDGYNNALENDRFMITDTSASRIVTNYSDNVNILVGIGQMGAHIGEATICGSLIFNKAEDIMSNIDKHLDRIEYTVPFGTTANIRSTDKDITSTECKVEQSSGNMYIDDDHSSILKYIYGQSIDQAIHDGYSKDNIAYRLHEDAVLSIVDSSSDIFGNIFADDINIGVKSDYADRLCNNNSDVVYSEISDIDYDSTNDKQADHIGIGIDSESTDKLSGSTKDYIGIGVDEKHSEKLLSNIVSDTSLSIDVNVVDSISAGYTQNLHVGINDDYVPGILLGGDSTLGDSFIIGQDITKAHYDIIRTKHIQDVNIEY